MTHWFCVIKGERRGPLAWEALRDYAAHGELQTNDFVWTPAFGDAWKQAGEVPGLIPLPGAPVAGAGQTVPALPVITPLPPLSDEEYVPSCIQAIYDAWARMTTVLFKPFDVTLWFGIGLCAWFASVGRHDWINVIDLTDLVGKVKAGATAGGWAEVVSVLSGTIKERLLAVLTVSAVALAALFSVLMMWVRARGALVFVDRWHRPRAPLAQTWRALRQAGNSLFVVRLVVMIAFLAVLLLGTWLGFSLGLADPAAWSAVPTAPHLFWLGGVLLVVAAWWVVSEMDRQFVVPIMYWRRFTAVDAWRLVVVFCNRQPFAIIRFLLLRLAFEAAVLVGIVIVTPLTCCLFPVVLGIPYFGSVAFLPVTFIRRGLGVSYLRQWKPDLTGQQKEEV